MIPTTRAYQGVNSCKVQRALPASCWPQSANILIRFQTPAIVAPSPHRRKKVAEPRCIFLQAFEVAALRVQTLRFPYWSACQRLACKCRCRGQACAAPCHSLRLQVAQSRSYLYTLRPKVGIIYILGAPGIAFLSSRVVGAWWTEASAGCRSPPRTAGGPRCLGWGQLKDRLACIYVYLYIYIYVCVLHYYI